MLKDIHDAKVVQSNKDGFNTCIALFDKEGKEMARSADGHPEGSNYLRYYLDIGMLTYVDFYTRSSKIGDEVFVSWRTLKPNL